MVGSIGSQGRVLCGASLVLAGWVLGACSGSVTTGGGPGSSSGAAGTVTTGGGGSTVGVSNNGGIGGSAASFAGTAGASIGGASQVGGSAGAVGQAGTGGAPPRGFVSCGQGAYVDPVSGLAQCYGSFVIARPQPVVCSEGAAGAASGGAAGSDGESAFGEAGASAAGAPGALPRPCANDSQCDAGSACFCLYPTGGMCVPASCHTNADCGGKSLCVLTSASRTLNDISFACTNEDDQCDADIECSDDFGVLCVLEGGRRTCQQSMR